MDEPVSKSQKKREADLVLQMGIAFIDLSLSKLDLLPLTDNLRQAILDAKLITSHGAKKRQAKLIAKLMRAADYDVIRVAYDRMLQEDNAGTAEFHEVEHWRDQLMHHGKEALTEFIQRYQPEEVQQLRQLIKKAIEDELKEKNTGASKALFRYLRSSIK